MKKIFLLLIAIVFALSVKAQDYVITVKGDSVSCKVSIPLMGAHKYKSATMNSAEKIFPTDIKEYYITRRQTLYRAVFKDSTSTPMFMTVVEKGPISLYEVVYTNYNGMATTTTTVWYAGKNSDNVFELKTSSLFLSKSKQTRKDELAAMLMDKKSIYDKYMAENEFSFKSIRNIIHLYNTGQPFQN